LLRMKSTCNRRLADTGRRGARQPSVADSTKPIGPVYERQEAQRLAAER
jgi:hypothetical protein